MKKSFLIIIVLIVSCQSDYQSPVGQVEMDVDDNALVYRSEILSQNSTSSFVHPGLINSKKTLDLIGVQDNLYRMDSYQEVLDVIDVLESQHTNSFPNVVYVRTPPHNSTQSEMQFRQDAVLAYAYALKWAREGNSIDAIKAINILNGWSSNFNNITACQEYHDPITTGCPPNVNIPGERRRLAAAWAAPAFAEAAEIIRHYKVNGIGAGWTSNDINLFEIFLTELNDYVELIVNYVRNGTGGWGEGWHNNWGASAAYAKIAIGVFLNDLSMYENGVFTIKEKLIPNIIKSSGEVNELDRDCSHPQMSLNALTSAAEIANNQGDSSVYTLHSNRIATGWEGIAMTYESGGAFNRNCSPTADIIYPGVELAHSMYSNSSGIAWLRGLQAPFGIDALTFIGFTTYTHYNTEQPLEVNIDGPEFVPANNYSSFDAVISGGSPSYTYVWEKSANTGGPWEVVGFDWIYGLVPTNENFFYLKVTVTDSENTVSTSPFHGVHVLGEE